MRQRAIWTALALALSTVASGHHSGAMFDTQKTVTLTGEVRVFQWTNPHCWIQLLVPGAQSATEWSIEMGSPSQLYNVGWRPRTLAAGSRITVQIHPLRDGSKGGIFISATHDTGEPLVANP